MEVALRSSRMTLAKVQEGVMALSVVERAKLVEWLLDGMQAQAVDKREELWGADAEHRIDAVDRGELPTFDGPSVLEEIRRSIGA